MARRLPSEQTSFLGGELSEDYRTAFHLAQRRVSVQRARNVRPLVSGALKVRPGSTRLAERAGPEIVVSANFSASLRFRLLFSAGSVSILDSDGALVQTIGSCPWGASDLPLLYPSVGEDYVIVAGHNFWPQVITRAAGGTWSLSDFAFAAGIAGALSQPYYKFAAATTKLQPSARTGTVTLTTSASFFVAGHVGTRVRYLGREIIVTAVTDGTTATGTVVNTLPPAVQLTVTDGSGFAVGQAVRGADTNVAGIITAVSGTTITVAIREGQTKFDVSGQEKLVGPDGAAKITAQTEVSPASLEDWDEQAISAVRGYPGGVGEHRGRLLFWNLRDLGSAVLASSLTALNDFNVGTGEDGDAVFEIIKAAPPERVLHCLSAEQLLLVTDRAVRYVPEGPDNVFRPTFATFRKVGTSGGSLARPLVTDEGVVFVEAGGNKMLAALPTGDTVRSWQVVPISDGAPHFIRNPQSLVLTSGNEEVPERYLMAVNDDGTICLLYFQGFGSDAILGWYLWTTSGSYLSMAEIDGKVDVIVSRSGSYFLERFEEGLNVDGGVAFDTSTGLLPLATTTGAILTGPDGAWLLTTETGIADLIGETVSIVDGSVYWGEYTVDANGKIPGIRGLTGAFQAGYEFDWQVWLWPPDMSDYDIPRGRPFRITRAYVHIVNSTRYCVNGQDVAGYREGSELGSPPPLRSETRKFRLPKWGDNQYVRVESAGPSPFELTGVGMEVVVS
ncbi:MAG: hypothetical protein HXY25_06945 [Alphaproteobacteria bacterium]|nr:hypothetical protein [Alphaproteobacteria bacterium]